MNIRGNIRIICPKLDRHKTIFLFNLTKSKVKPQISIPTICFKNIDMKKFVFYIIHQHPACFYRLLEFIHKIVDALTGVSMWQR